MTVLAALFAAVTAALLGIAGTGRVVGAFEFGPMLAVPCWGLFLLILRGGELRGRFRPMIPRRTKPAPATPPRVDQPPQHENPGNFPEYPAEAVDVYTNPTVGTYKQMPAPADPLVSLTEAVDLGIIEGLNLNAARAASKRANFPQVVTRQRRGNTGAPEKLYHRSELVAWNAARMRHPAESR